MAFTFLWDRNDVEEEEEGEEGVRSRISLAAKAEPPKKVNKNGDTRKRQKNGSVDGDERLPPIDTR